MTTPLSLDPAAFLCSTSSQTLKRPIGIQRRSSICNWDSPLTSIGNYSYHRHMKCVHLKTLFRSTHCLWMMLILCLVYPVSADGGVGTTSFSFVRIIPGARQAALGGAFASVAGDVNNMMWNPAGLARIQTKQVVATLSNYFLDLQYGLIGYAHPLHANQVVGIGIQYLSFGSFQETTPTDPTGSQLGTFGADDLAIALSYSRQFGAYLSGGANLKLLYERIKDTSMDGLAVDMGLHLSIPGRRIHGAVVLQNAGLVRSSLAGRRDPLPLSIRAGVGYTPAHLPLLILLEVETGRSQGLAGRIGGEFTMRERFFVRGGYASTANDLRLEPSDSRLTGVTGGIGIQARSYRLDYAVTPTLRLGTVHRISLTYHFK
jgi:hypothetical protein